MPTTEINICQMHIEKQKIDEQNLLHYLINPVDELEMLVLVKKFLNSRNKKIS